MVDGAIAPDGNKKCHLRGDSRIGQIIIICSGEICTMQNQPLRPQLLIQQVNVQRRIDVQSWHQLT